MTIPWIEIAEARDQEVPAVPGSSEFVWQAMFACLVSIPTHQEWSKLKWGWNVAALFDEAMERQKLFLESQYCVRTDANLESPDRRTLAFRFINLPGEGLLVSVLGKIHGRSQEEAQECALAYFTELESTFPYDYALIPAESRKEFLELSGSGLLEDHQAEPVQIKREEAPIQLNRNPPFLQGFWHSSPRAHEPIWRMLAAASTPLLLNVSLRSTILYEKDRERLLVSADEIPNHQDGFINQKTLNVLKQWNRDFVERRLQPWKKFFYLQIHLVSPGKRGGNLARILGASLTMGGTGPSQPGYRVIYPANNHGSSWRKKLMNLEPIFSGSFLPAPRLSEIADLEEVFAVMRLPYSPPDNGLPGVNFWAGLRNDAG